MEILSSLERFKHKIGWQYFFLKKEEQATRLGRQLEPNPTSQYPTATKP